MLRLSLLVLGLLVACGGREQTASMPRPRTPGPRYSMMALHAMGGVPPGWKLTPPAGDVPSGRRLFVELGCASCHRVAGEPFSVKPVSGVGPELTGMGAHHPPAYFAEAILNPDAILIDGPGYIGPDGHSVMPDYPDMTIAQLADLVAYLSSLTTGDPHAGHMMPATTATSPQFATRPDPPPQTARAFFVQSYDVKPRQLDAFQSWWKRDGASRFLAYPGLLAVDTYADFARSEKPYTSIFAFRDDNAMATFLNDPATEPLGAEFDAFIGDHGHETVTRPPIYRVPSLSAP